MYPLRMQHEAILNRDTSHQVLLTSLDSTFNMDNGSVSVASALGNKCNTETFSIGYQGRDSGEARERARERARRRGGPHVRTACITCK